MHDHSKQTEYQNKQWPLLSDDQTPIKFIRTHRPIPLLSHLQLWPQTLVLLILAEPFHTSSKQKSRSSVILPVECGNHKHCNHLSAYSRHANLPLIPLILWLRSSHKPCSPLYCTAPCIRPLSMLARHYYLALYYYHSSSHELLLAASINPSLAIITPLRMNSPTACCFH